MKYKKYEKYESYRKMKKRLLTGASTGIVAGMIMMGVASTAMAESDISVPSNSKEAGINGMHMMHRWNSTTKAKTLAAHLGLNPDLVNGELKSGKNLKQILQDNGIVPGQLQKAFEKKARKPHNRSW